MIFYIPNLKALRRLMLSLDYRLVSSDLHLKWMTMEKEEAARERELRSEMGVYRGEIAQA